MVLITGYNSDQAPLGDLTAPLMEAYARRHKLGFRCVHFAATGKEAYWQKIIETLRAFDEGFDRVFWLDADQAITDSMLLPEVFTSHMERHPECVFSASQDWGNDAGELDFSMCGYVASAKGRGLFEWVNERHDEYINGDFPEQTPMRMIVQKQPRESFDILPRRYLNAVPEEVSPGNVVRPWDESCFAAHITMRCLEDRIKIFQQVMARV